MINRILDWFRERKLRQYTAKERGDYPGYEHVHSIGIFFTYGEVEDAWLEQLISDFESDGKLVQVLCYYPASRRRLSTHFPWPCYCRGETNWLGEPNTIEYRHFTKHYSDVLIDIHSETRLSFRFVRSCAHPRLSLAMGDQDAGWADIQIAVQPRKEGPAARKELIKYLQFINKQAS